jgi:SAM-dependent methyltransferase
MRKEAVRYWDEIAAQHLPAVRDAMLAGFRSERAFDESGRVDARHLLLPFFSRSDRVLDVGCGIARLLKWVAPHCREAIGLDVSAGLLRIARERLAGLSNVRVKQLPRSLAFPIATGTIDFAYYYHVSLHVDREDNLRILQELRRCLGPRGRALVQFSLIEHPDLREDLVHWAQQRDRAELAASYFTESEAAIFLALAKLHPQLRLFIPGEFVAVVTRRDGRALGEMPRVLLPTEEGGRPAPRHARSRHPAKRSREGA